MAIHSDYPHHTLGFSLSPQKVLFLFSPASIIKLSIGMRGWQAAIPAFGINGLAADCGAGTERRAGVESEADIRERPAQQAYSVAFGALLVHI